MLRAAVLLLAFEVARFHGRPVRLSNLLGLAAIVLFLMHVANLENVGVHLSFLAVAAIGVFVLAEREQPEAGGIERLIQQHAGTLSKAMDSS